MLPQRCVLETVCFFVRLIVFNFFHNFKFEGEGMRIWRAYGIGQGRLIPYQDFIVKPQGPTGLVVNENFFPLKAARLHKTTTNSDGGKSNGLFAGSEPGCNMAFKKCSELESHLDKASTATFAEILIQLMIDLKETGWRNSSMLTKRILTELT